MIKIVIVGWKVIVIQTTHDHVMGWRVGPRDPTSKASLLNFTKLANIQNLKLLVN